MEPTYHNMQMVLLDKKNEDYNHNDIIAFRCEGLSAILVKRVIGCPGDEVLIYKGKLYVNSEIYPFFKEQTFEYAGLLEKKITLSNGEYLVIGDNLSASRDSRYAEVGVIQVKNILGKIL